MQTQLVAVGSFVKRQTPESRYSHHQWHWDYIADLVAANMKYAKPGYRNGVMLVPVPPDGFFCGVVEVTKDTPLYAKFESRRMPEDPYIVIEAAGGEKLPAKAVEIVIYHHDVLAENNEADTDAEWEIVSINARPTLWPEPMTPMAMARNMLQLPGGTKAEYTAQQFAEAIVYWSRHAMRG